MRRYFAALAVGLAACPWASSARAQVVVDGTTLPDRTTRPGIYSPPGFYGTTYGAASFGLARTYSSFPSPSGVGYGYGLAPTSFLPGPYGVGLWRPGRFVPAGTIYGTFVADSNARGYPSPPIGVYAPAFGPGETIQP